MDYSHKGKPPVTLEALDEEFERMFTRYRGDLIKISNILVCNTRLQNWEGDFQNYFWNKWLPILKVLADICEERNSSQSAQELHDQCWNHYLLYLIGSANALEQDYQECKIHPPAPSDLELKVMIHFDPNRTKREEYQEQRKAARSSHAKAPSMDDLLKNILNPKDFLESIPGIPRKIDNLFNPKSAEKSQPTLMLENELISSAKKNIEKLEERLNNSPSPYEPPHREHHQALTRWIEGLPEALENDPAENVTADDYRRLLREQLDRLPDILKGENA